jgi:hypothetical protein
VQHAQGSFLVPSFAGDLTAARGLNCGGETHVASEGNDNAKRGLPTGCGLPSRSGEEQAALGFGNGPPKFASRFEPFCDHSLDVSQSLLSRGTVGRATS